MLRRLRAQMAAAGFDMLAPGLAGIFSAGLTGITATEGHEAAIARADEALYRAQQADRDRVVSA